MLKHHPLQSLLLTGLLLALVSSTTAHAVSPAGVWKGSWHSRSTGHQGTLRAHISPLPNGDYRAVFSGRFAAVIPFIYPARLSPVPGVPGRYTSSQRLPLLGTYRMTASVTSSQFLATFGGRKDAGTFVMRRTAR